MRAHRFIYFMPLKLQLSFLIADKEKRKEATRSFGLNSDITGKSSVMTKLIYL
jgi:hypothetical protein